MMVKARAGRRLGGDGEGRSESGSVSDLMKTERRMGQASAAILISLVLARAQASEPPDIGAFPVDSAGRALNLGFETGTLADWTAEGEAFKGQPIAGDVVARRRSDSRSDHAGRYWVGSYERGGDAPTGTLTSRPFRATRPFASFLVGGGSRPGTRVEVVAIDTSEVLFHASGDDDERMERVVVDLSSAQGRTLVIRLVDHESGGWGHVNFDDFRIHATRPRVPSRRRESTPDVVAHAGLAPEAAARAMTLPAGFQVTLFAREPDVVQPIAMTVDDRGRVSVAEAYSYPRKVPASEAQDRILILEDSNGDGRFDSRKVFAEKLNLVSGLEVGYGGAWVGAAPDLLFIPDRDGDDHPDGPPEVVLDGWGSHDTHETLNSLAWGPDGWLHGCHGVFTHSRVGKPGAPDKDRTPLNAGVWRYHPTRKVFELFAEGTSNPWGVDWDERGRMFITACVIPHLYYMIQGGRYERQAGQHFNQYTYDDIKTIADHRHYVGANPHAGNGRSDQAGGGHAHAGAMIYQGGDWPDEYRGSIFMNNIHGARINRDILKPSGSGFVGTHAPDFLLANDVWSQIVSIKQAPDGGVYLLDWYDKNQCHHAEVDAHDRTNGRIFKVTHGAPRGWDVDLGKAEDQALAAELAGDEWSARHARRILAERGPRAETQELLEDMLEGFPARPVVRLRALWALHASASLSEQELLLAIEDADPSVRAWAIRLSVDQGRPPSALLKRIAELARDEVAPEVRLALASAVGRLPLEDRWVPIEGLLARGGDAADHNLPLMIWYALEPLGRVDPTAAMARAERTPIVMIAGFMARRVASARTDETLAIVLKAAVRATDSAHRLALLDGIAMSYQGTKRRSPPDAWVKAAPTLAADPDPGVRGLMLELGAEFGDVASARGLRAIVGDPAAIVSARRKAMATLVRLKDAELPPILRGLVESPAGVADPEIRGAAVRGLASYVDPAADRALLGVYARLGETERRDVLNTLAARKSSARLLLTALESGAIPRGDFTADLARQVANLDDPDLREPLARVWGSARKTSADRARLIREYKALLVKPASPAADPSLGRAVFAKVCRQCHVLFGEGGKIGPELTGSNRADLDYVLSNVLDPSALIGKDYLAQVVATTDGRVLTGIIKAEDDASITLALPNETLTIPKTEIDARRSSDQSMMPEDLWKPLSEHEIRSLVAYLASPAQVSAPTPGGEAAP